MCLNRAWRCWAFRCLIACKADGKRQLTIGNLQEIQKPQVNYDPGLFNTLKLVIIICQLPIVNYDAA